MEESKSSSHPVVGGGDEDMEVGECSDDGDEEDEEEEDMEMGSSPLTDHGSLMMALASSNVLPYEGLASPLRLTSSGGKPLTLKRGPGRPPGSRPRKEAGVRLKKPLGLKLKRWKGGVYMPSDKSPRHSMDCEGAGDGGSEKGVDGSPAHSSEPSTPHPDDKDKHHHPAALDDSSSLFHEQWPGKVCAFCNLSERSQLGQGELMKIKCPEGFVPQKKEAKTSDDGLMSPPVEPEEFIGPDKSPRTLAMPLSHRRQKNWAKCRNSSINGQEPLDELSIIGYAEEPELTNVFENAGENQWYVYVHESCALWSLGIKRPSDPDLQSTGDGVIQAISKKCAYCSRLCASVACTFNNCQKVFHLPCAAASGAFQDNKTYAVVCNLHLDQVSLMPTLGDVTCMTCYSLGDVSNLMMCSMCGNHYHGMCVGLALLPGVRAGWQCADCRMCQVCRQPEDVSKVMLCETCDKAYHPHCLRPVVTTIPKYGWKCKNCRLCSDCGSRTPGAGQSSRWHAHYTVCDSCYQQRNKGFSCPLCHRAYRAASYREMVQCSKCKKFVHGTCDPEADLSTYQQKKEVSPEYEYICPTCKSGRQSSLKRKDSTEDFGLDSNMSASQESLIGDEFDFDYSYEREAYGIGLGKGKPFCASKIAKKKFGFSSVITGRGKSFGKISAITAAITSYQKKHQRFTEFGRKRGPKAKMRGIFGVPGLGLQRPQADTSSSSQNKSDEEPGGENRLVLCSAKDKFVLSQDMCVMCGALGTDQEGCLIACAQCGQCYHPYCVSVKVTKVILQKGWRCLDCTVCEGCGQRNDEARLILCDDCDISYHIYCMDPPLPYVPRGTWKCKWCAQCLTCGAKDPGVNCVWLRNYTECGPCASRTTCPCCAQPYQDADLIIKCIQCERWLHCTCDSINTESEAEFCAEDGYTCILCRPKGIRPPHLLPHNMKVPSPCRSPEMSKHSWQEDFYMDGVCLSEYGLHQIRALTIEQQVQPRKKRANPRRHPSLADRDAISATIESVIAGEIDCGGPDEEEYREGMTVAPKPDGRPPEPPEGFTIYTTESGVMILRRKRVRNLQKLGIGGFNARLRNTRYRDKDEEGGGEGNAAPTSTTPDGSTTPTGPGACTLEDKPRRKPQRRKPKSKLVENYPSYLQEAFFGRDLLDTTKETGQDLNSSSEESDEGTNKVSQDKTITLSQDELKVIEEMKAKQEKDADVKPTETSQQQRPAERADEKSPIKEEDEGSDAEAFKDILRLPDNLLDTDLVNTIMTEGDGDIKSEDALMADSSLADDSDLNSSSATTHKDELSDILGPHFSLESMVRDTGLPNMDSKDVEEIFKGVLTDESQESQESAGVFPMTSSTPATTPGTPGVLPQGPPPIMSPSHSVVQSGLGLPRQQVGSSLPSVVHSNLPSPIGAFPAASPYHSEYSNSPQFSPAFSEPPSPWGPDDGVGDSGGSHASYNQRSTLKMEADEALGNGATISAVLYANLNHPEWKKEYPTWTERCKQILKKWRVLSSDKKAPYLQQARDNRANLRMKKTQQDQDKLQQQKSVREAEQERQWKQLQALRQQQAATQQQVMQDQRAQVTNRVQRQLSGETIVQMPSETSLSQLQVSTVTESGGTLPSISSPGAIRGPQQFSSPVGIKVQRVVSPVVQTYPRPGPPVRTVNPPAPQDPFAPPRQVQPLVHPVGVQGQEMNRQLRDLLQRQHIKNKLESEQIIQPRVWPQEDQNLVPSSVTESATNLLSPAGSQPQSNVPFDTATTVSSSPTFRHPLPPSLARPTRLALPQSQMVIRGQRMPAIDPRLQGVDPRLRLLIQQQQRPGFPAGGQIVTRLPAPRNPLDPYDHLVQQRPVFTDGTSAGAIVRQQAAAIGSDPTRIQPQASQPQLDQQRLAVASGNDAREEIPESVTAELEKLEQEEGSAMVEVEGVNAILGDLVEDDDELLAEMGADFNILEYADPELDNVTGGEKTNILDEIEDEDTKKDNSRLSSQQQKKDNISALPQDSSVSSVSGDVDKKRVEVSTEKKQTSGLPVAETAEQMQASQLIRSPTPMPMAAAQQQSQMAQNQQSGLLQGVTPQLLGQSQPGVVASVSYPPSFPTNNQTVSRIQHLGQVAAQQQRLQLQRLATGPRVVSVGQILPAPSPVAAPPVTRLAPPPPPYPGPPPPYPGPLQQEQPLLLEDLLEQEKREQEKQAANIAADPPAPPAALLSDADFERLRADVLGTTQTTVVASPPHALPAQGMLNTPGLIGQSGGLRPAYPPRPPSQWQQPQQQQQQPQQQTSSPIVRTPVAPPTETTLRVPLFNAPVLPSPPPPPDIIATDADRQTQLHYESWLTNQNHIVTQQLKYYETEVQKLRKIRKSLNSKQRQARKNGNELAENDAVELQRVTAEQAVLQKQLEASRKQSRQHGVLMQEYQNKQRANKAASRPVGPGPSGTPLHPSPSGASPQSPLLMSPSPGPLVTQNSMSPLQQQSPRIGTPLSQVGEDNPFSPGTPGTQDILRSLPSPNRLTSPSPRGLTSPRAPNPPAPATPRPTVGSPGGFPGQDQVIRPPGIPPRFVRSPESGLRPRTGILVPGPTSTPIVYQGPRTPSPAFTGAPSQSVMSSPADKMVRLGLTPQQQQLLLQRQQLQQQRQALIQQQQELSQEAGGLRQITQQRVELQQQQQQQPQQQLESSQQRQIQIQQQRQALLQQQELLQQQQNDASLSPQQRQQIAQQRQALLLQIQELTQQERAQRVIIQGQEIVEGGLSRQQQLQMLQRQQQLAQQSRQQLILSQQGKAGQFRQMLQQQQQQQSQQQSPSRSPMGQFGQTSPIVQHFAGTPTSPMPSQSPMQTQFPNSSPLHPQSPMINQAQSGSPVLPQSPLGIQQQFSQPTSSSPMHPQSSVVHQFPNQNTPSSPMTSHSPRVQQSYIGQTPNSPLTPQSPMLQNQNYQQQQQQQQPSSSPMHHVQFSQPQSPRVQPQFGQPPNSPVPPHSPFIHQTNSPMPPRSPMGMPSGSPMTHRRPSSTGGSIGSSPQIPDRPQSVENPTTPRTPQEELPGGSSGGGGGGNPHNPINPLPLPPGFGRFGYFKLGLRGGAPMWNSGQQSKKLMLPKKCTDSSSSSNGSNASSSKSESPVSSVPVSKVASLVCIDYNEFDDESSKTPPLTPPPNLKNPVQKKQMSSESQDSKPADDNVELTVYEDIVLVESCKDETNLEVEELQSSLEGNVMSMPMVIDPGHIQIAEMSLDSGNVEGELLEECLVTSTDLVVLDVEPNNEDNDGCLLQMVDKEDAECSGQDDILILEDDLERESKGDDSEVIELIDESPSPPVSRTRMVGKVLPGEPLKKIQEKRDSTTDTPDSPDQEEGTTDRSPEAYTSETDTEIVSTTFESATEKTEIVSTTTPDNTKEEQKQKIEKTLVPIVTISSQQTNIVPVLSRPGMSYSAFTQAHMPRHILPVIKSDGRSVIAVQQATVANLVQDAVNAAKLAAEKKNLSHVSLSSGVMIPSILSTSSNTQCTTLITQSRTGTGTTHYVPFLAQADKLGLLKIEGIKVINPPITVDDLTGEKTSTMLTLATKQHLETKIVTQCEKPVADSKLVVSKPGDRVKVESHISSPHPSKIHNYSKILTKTPNSSPVKSRSQDSSDCSTDVIKQVDVIQRSEAHNTSTATIVKSFSHGGVICNKRSSIDLPTTVGSVQQSSVITQVSVINDAKTVTPPTSQEHEETTVSVTSSILEAQLTAPSTRDDILLTRSSSANSPSKTLFSFLDNVTAPQKEKTVNDENKKDIIQSTSINTDNALLFEDAKVHTEGMTLYRSSEAAATQSNITHILKTVQTSIAQPVTVAQVSEEQRIIVTQPAFSRRIGNIYVHSQNIKQESVTANAAASLIQFDQRTIKQETEQSSDQKFTGTQRSISVVYSTDLFQTQSKDSSVIESGQSNINNELKVSSSLTDLFKSEQKREAERRDVSLPPERQLVSSKSVPSRLGELISGSADVQAHIERRISIAGQTDLGSRSFVKEELLTTTTALVPAAAESVGPIFCGGSQKESVPKENSASTQFIPLSSILTQKIEAEDKPVTNKFATAPRISEESQNVLLKQLLQNTACATTSSTATTQSAICTVPIKVENESQLQQPPPTPAPAPQVTETPKLPQQLPRQQTVVPLTSPSPTPTTPVPQQTSPQTEMQHVSASTPTSVLDELVSPTSSSCSLSQTSPAIKREPVLLTPSQIKREPQPIVTPSIQPSTTSLPKSSPVMVEVKKEEGVSSDEISPGIRQDQSENSSIQSEHSSSMPLDPQDLKKLKRRQYQQKRRQSQGKEAIGGTPKKRPRKSSKVEEDYDSFIDALMVQLRQTPAMSILEPSLSRNYTVCPIFGAGDLSKVHLNCRQGELKGSFGSASLPTECDYYNTEPFGDLLPLPPQLTPSTQRGFYNEEFAPLKLDSYRDEFDDRKHDFSRERDNDTPDTIISSSSPEYIVPEIPVRYPGLRLIDEDLDSEEEEKLTRRSPIIPIQSSQLVRPQPNRYLCDMDKENLYRDNSLTKPRMSPSVPLKDSGNVTVTLTLTSAAADDVLGVLRNLANVLRIPAPTAFHITERTATPPSHKLGLYRSKGKDGKEGAPVDIQSILNGAAKFCRHCDVVILNNLIKKKASEMPFLSREESSEDLYFCSSVCYMQLALLHHPPSISQDKAAAIVDHLSQSDHSPPKKSRVTSVDQENKKRPAVKQPEKENEEPTPIKMEVDEVKSPTTTTEVEEPVKEKPVAPPPEVKPKAKGVRYRIWSGNNIPPPANKFKRPTDKEMTETLFRMGITVTPSKIPEDTRTCLFCHQIGDGVADGPARLLNFDVDKWVHLNCALWSDEVYETVNGALMNVETALQQSLTANCSLCHRTGATLKCYKMRCSAVYHLSCAVKDECVFFKNKTLYCNMHVPKNEKDNELTTLAVFRRVYVNRDENRQVASVMHHTEHNHLLRVGTLIFLNVGQLLPHQLDAFHTPNYIYPIGYKIVRFYWSMRVCNKRCRYICSIHEANGRPEFRVLVQEPTQDDIELRDSSPRALWTRILEPLAALRKSNNNIQVFPKFLSGEDLFGLTEPAIVRVLESLPGVETLTDYRFKYGRNPLLELPLAINPSGCARCEGRPKGLGHWKRAHTQRTGSVTRPNYTPNVALAGDVVCPYSKQFVHSKASQYKKMKQEWRNNVYLARSKIQGLGLYAARDLERHTMVIEYIGEIIRTELAETREKQYEAKNRGIYMFRLDEDRVVDATLSGGLARYINHSCNPNCVAETVEVERDQRIIIFAKRRISRGEELAYDYKFDIEDDQHKIPCNCGAPNCRKWMN